MTRACRAAVPAIVADDYPVAKAAARPAVHQQQARAKGFALDMAIGGADAEDMDFRESA